MDQRLDLLTLGVADLDAARRFYLDGLGWTAVSEVPGEVIFLQLNHGLLLALWGVDELAADVDATPLATGTAPVALAHNVRSDEEVEVVLARAEAAGGRILKHAQRAVFGGLQGYFADPSGFLWEVAHNPGWSVDADGRVAIG